MSANTIPRGNFGLPDWLVSYRSEWLRPDVLAGLTTAAVVIPKSMAYATIAGLPVQVGLYTAFLPMVIYAFLGTSRPLSVSTSTTLAILTAAELGEVVPNGDAAGLLAATATLTLLVGAMLVLASILRLGFVANFISEPVLIGFKAGIGLVIVIDQIPKILGVHFARGTFVQNLLSTFKGIAHASPWTLAVGVAAIVLLLAVNRISHAAPAPLLAVAGGIAGAYFLNLHAHGVGVGGAYPKRPAIDHASLFIACRATVARRVGHRTDELYGIDCGRTGLCQGRRTVATSKPRVAGNRICERRAAPCSVPCPEAVAPARLR